eukprot:tig00000025_g7932.t1
MIRSVLATLGRAAPMGRAQEGLFAGRQKAYGNNVSFSNRKTRRTWLPNVQPKTLRSDILGESMKIKVTTHALRCIDRHGSLDAYLLNTKDKYIDSEFGVALKRRIEAAMAAKQVEAAAPAAAPAAAATATGAAS